jgi:hypothetical protein
LSRKSHLGNLEHVYKVLRQRDNDEWQIFLHAQQHNGNICGSFCHPYSLRIQLQNTNRFPFGAEPQRFYNADRQKGSDKLGYRCSLFRFRVLCESLLILEVNDVRKEYKW